MKSSLTAGLAVFAAIAMAGTAHADITIATAGPMTGQYAVFGEQMRRGAELAVEDLNLAGGVLGSDVALKIGPGLQRAAVGAFWNGELTACCSP